MKLLVALFLGITLYANNYAKLQEFKLQHPQQHDSIQRTTEQHLVLGSKVSIRFHRLLHFNFENFEQEYALKLHNCIGSKICIFSYVGEPQNVNDIFKNIEEQYDEVESIKLSKKYNMKIF